MKRRFDSATCPNCQTLFDRLPVDGDEDGNCWLVMESKPCHTCLTLPCPNCSQFACDGCGQTHCSKHLALVEDGTPDPLKCCAVCAAECEVLEPALPAIGVCVDCEQTVDPLGAYVQRSGDVWHTACFNAMTEEYRQYAEEQENLDGFRHLYEDAAYPAKREPATAPGIAARQSA